MDTQRLNPPAPSLPSLTSRRRLVGGALATILAGRSAPARAVVEPDSAGTGILPQPGGPAEAAPAVRPNVVLIVLDDMDVGAVAFMPNVQELLADQGATFVNFFDTTPACGPSRASLLRGQYAHNHGVLRNNNGEDGGFESFHTLEREESTVATWLHDAGYRTALIGKYMNGYPEKIEHTYVPPGWDEFHAPLKKGEDNYFDYKLNDNGDVVAYGHADADYSTDVYARRAIDFIERIAPTGDPFFMYLAPYAPHGPSVPAPRHAEIPIEATAPRPPSFDEEDVSDKPRWIRESPRLGAVGAKRIDRLFQQRLRSLMAVDEMVADLVETLGTVGALENTFIVFTADNGFHLGEHRVFQGKHTPYDGATRVPLIVRGPGVAAGVTVEPLALNIDLAPTFAALAGASAPDFVDGRSLEPLLGEDPPATWRQAFLVEDVAGDAADAESEATPPFRALRALDRLYVEYDSGERELYDLVADPDQLDNLAAETNPRLIDSLSTRLTELTRCEGPGCRVAEDAALDRFGST